MRKKIIKNKQHALLCFLAIIVFTTSIAFAYGVIRTFGKETTLTKGVIGDTVYVNDRESDYYYYTGMYYTYSADATTPTLENKNLYGNSNLVNVTINYNGRDKENKYTGYVSLEDGEDQSKFVYYKVYPVENGYINIELIDNPFSNHPNNLVFNGWITDYQGATISYDSTYYSRHLKVPVTYSGTTPNDIEINLYARWTKGKVGYLTNNRTFNNIRANLDTAGMHEITIDNILYEDPSVEGYFIRDVITTTTTITGSWWNQHTNTEYGKCTDCYNSSGTYYGDGDEYSCPAPNTGWGGAGTYTNDCNVYYKLTATDTYDPDKTYYRRNNNGSFSQVTLSPTAVGIKDDDLFDNNMNMAGYYRQVTRRNNQSLEGYYNSNGVLQSGSCRNTCTVYELVQYYDQDNNPELFDIDETYYYLATRDTNIVVMTTNTSSVWGNNFTVPFTLTGIYNGRNYNPTWDVDDSSIVAYSNLRIENLKISTNISNLTTAPSNSTSASGVFYGNYFNVKLGRNIKRVDDNVNFNSVQGAMNVSWAETYGSAGSPRRYKMEVESGFYNSATATYGATTSTNRMATLYSEVYVVYGNDYDRVTETNDNLDLYYSAAASWSGYLHSSDDTYNPTVTTTVKSGYLGSSKYDLTSGVYVGARYGGSHYAPRVMKIEGGHVYNVVGAPSTSDTKASLNACNIYMTGGVVDLITGGAGTSTTYGNRITQVTGGVVNYGVIGGSNGRDGESTDGTLTGDTYVYIGGTAVIGNDDLINSDSDDAKMYGVESGSVFGAGNGNSTYATIGSVKNSNIVINDNAVIKKNVYGSGNYGTVGYNSSTSSTTTNIKLLGGTVNGSVFGSGNNSGSGREDEVTSTINIKLDGGKVLQSIYGGSNAAGVVYGSTNIEVINGDTTNIFGGGYGAKTSVERDVLVNVGNDATTRLNITGDVYGGSAFGTVNNKEETQTKSSYTTTVNINNGTTNNVFGGGKGDSDNSPCVAGNITVNVNGGTVSNVFGGNNANGTPLGDVVVNINDGTITNVYGGNNIGGTVPTTNVNVNGGTTGTVYGGGKEATSTTTNVIINNGTITNAFGGGASADVTSKSNVTLNGGTVSGAIYGGSNQDGIVAESFVNIKSSVPTVYGGNNDGGKTTTSTVYLTSGTISTAYGGGNNAQTTTTNVNLNGANVTGAIFGGGNSAGVEVTNVNLITGKSSDVYGGSNSNGTVKYSNVKATNATNLSVTSVYGGNNAGGKTEDAHINIVGGTYTNIYGGGNNAVTDYTNVTVNGINVNGNFFGGGNNANVNYNTIVNFTDSTIAGDIFGGGNLGEILGNTTVKISNSTVNGSAYGGGNGQTAVVHGNPSISIDNGSVIGAHVFGGGNAANTGTEEANSSISTVNIAGATIHGNVYGGANTAVLYGIAKVNVGTNQGGLTKTDIQIDGTVFGGGEANASGSSTYDFNFIGVTTGIEVNIDGNEYNNFNINGSIFGSGNASSTSGYSYINISNYGTFDNYKENISIQRTDVLTIKNSAIKLQGARDRTNEFSTVEFALSRIPKLILANDSTLFLDTGVNLVESFYSEKITGTTEEKATVNITKSGTVTKNTNNRVYMQEGKNLNIATNETATAYGKVSGMTFFGMYQLDRNGKVVTSLYDKKYNAGDTATSGALYAFTLGSYVQGEHHKNHDLEVDGFYSNYPDSENEGKIKVDYVDANPPDAGFYRWSIGEKVTTYEVELTASKYATLGTCELPLDNNIDPNTTFQILGFNYEDLEEGFELVDPNEIPRINTSGTADTKMGLSFETANSGFTKAGSTTFMTNENTPVSGTKTYIKENSTAVASLLFYFYHSKNITQQRKIGTVVISLQTVTPVDELNNRINRVNIKVTLSSALFNNNYYEGAMTSGERYSMFASSPTNINTNSTLSAYYSLYMTPENSYYKTGYHHTLVSSYVFPEKTKMTLLDLIDGETYYYVVDSTAVNNAKAEYDQYGECSYELANFVKMGSTSSDNNYDETKNISKYYDASLGAVQEEFIVMINFEDTQIEGNQLGNLLLMELRNNSNNTLINVLGIQRSALTYNLYDDANAIVEIEGNLNTDTVYIGDTVTLNLTGNFTQPIVNSLPVVDTSHFNKKPGVKLTIYDSDNNQLNNSSLLGLSYTVDGIEYYPRMDGSVRIALADKVANIFKRIKINTNNVNLTSGNYKLKVESFTSPDGIYYGTNSHDSIEIPFNVINSTYGLKVELTDNEMMIDKDSGLNLNENNVLDFKVNYSSSFENPNIRVGLYRRSYNEIYSTKYNKVNLLNYVTNDLTAIRNNENEYMFIDNPTDGMNKSLYLKSLLVSGTYKFVFSLYDGDTYIGDCIQYVIIK